MTSRIDFEDRGLSHIIDEVAAEHYCTVDEILSGDKTAHVAKAFRALSVRLRELGMSYPAIGRLLNRDHSTIIEAVNRRRWAAARHGRVAVG